MTTLTFPGLASHTPQGWLASLGVVDVLRMQRET